MSAYLYMFAAPMLAEVENQVAMFLLCLDYVVIFYAWSGLQLNYGPANLFNCPAEPNIPIFLCVAAFTQGIGVICIIVPCWCSGWTMEGARKKAYIALLAVLGSALLLIYILGAAWVFSIYSVVQYDSPRADTYCDKETYRFAVWCVGITFGLVWVTLIVLFVTTWWPKISRRSQYSDMAADV